MGIGLFSPDGATHLSEGKHVSLGRKPSLLEVAESHACCALRIELVFQKYVL
jgi:hypothetical protein